MSAVLALKLIKIVKSCENNEQLDTFTGWYMRLIPKCYFDRIECDEIYYAIHERRQGFKSINLYKPSMEHYLQLNKDV